MYRISSKEFSSFRNVISSVVTVPFNFCKRGFLPFCRHFLCASFSFYGTFVVVVVFLHFFCTIFFFDNENRLYRLLAIFESLLEMLPLASTSNEELEDFHCKIVLVGDCKCGKTALIHQFVNDEFLQVSKR